MKFKLDREKINKIIPFVICLFIAFLVWLYVMYVNAPKYTYTFENIPVEVGDIPSRFLDCEVKIDSDYVSADFYGTNVALSKCERSGIKGHINLTKFSEPGSYDAEVIFDYPAGASLDCRDTVKVSIIISEPQVYMKPFTQIPVVIENNNLQYETILEQFDVISMPSAVDVVISSFDEAILSVSQDKVKAIADISSLNIFGAGEYPSVKLKFVCDGIEIVEHTNNIYISILVSPKDSETD